MVVLTAVHAAKGASRKARARFGGAGTLLKT